MNSKAAPQGGNDLNAAAIAPPEESEKGFHLEDKNQAGSIPTNASKDPMRCK
jgi:hypothetical protein